MKEQIKQSLKATLVSIAPDVPDLASLDIQLDRTKDRSHGDFATNIALILSKKVKQPPRDFAQNLVDALPEIPGVENVTVAGPGFINFFLESDYLLNVIQDILRLKSQYGRRNIGNGQRVLIEFVSANPTGPLHVGHGRGAAFGASLVNVLKKAGFDVEAEYYVNDAGRQMDILATSVWLRYLTLAGVSVSFPSNGYKGDYIIDIAKSLQTEHGDGFVKSSDEVFNGVVPDESADGGDKEQHIDSLIANAKQLLGEDYAIIHQLSLQSILSDIQNDLKEFGVTFNTWYSEKQLHDSEALETAVQTLLQNEVCYEKDGAIWFRTTQFGDEKDRVVKRKNGQYTYFASDIAYHADKFARGFDAVIDILGADHHGYVPRLKASIEALKYDSKAFNALLVQFAILYRGKEKISMSTRSGSFVTLRELREEVGNDAARFFYVMRKPEQHLDFDLELAKSRSNENPVYYIQYAHARICSVMTKATAEGFAFDEALACKHLSELTTSHEVTLVNRLSQYPEIIANAAKQYEPHVLVHYLKDLAGEFHSYYNAEKVILADEAPRNARLALSLAVKYVIADALGILGVSAPESM